MLNLSALVKKHATSVALEVKNELGEHLAVSASVYVMSSSSLWALAEEMKAQLEDEIFEKLRNRSPP